MLCLTIATIVIASNTAMVISDPSQASKSHEQQQEVFLGVSHELLFKQLGYSYSKMPLGSSGVPYAIVDPNDLAKPSFLTIGVHMTTHLAEEEYKTTIRWTPAGRSATENVVIGHTFSVWLNVSNHGGKILWRRDNVYVLISFNGDQQQMLLVAKKIDELIANDRQIAPRGVWPTPPRIADVTLEGARKLDSDIDVTLDIEGLQVDLHQTSLHSTIRALYRDDSALYNYDCDDLLYSENGKLILRLLKPKSQPVAFIVADKMNVIVTKTIEVELEE